MSYFAITIDVESDSAAFNRKIHGTRGVTEGMRIYLDFLRECGYPVTLFIACDVLHKLDATLLLKKDVEIASHGYIHTYPPYFLTKLPNERLLVEIRISKKTLENFFNRDVFGFRTHGLRLTQTILEMLSKHYKYDSSILLHRRYAGKMLHCGNPYHPSKHCVVERGNLPIVELPVSSKRVAFFTLPFNGSYIRLFPGHFFYNLNHSLIVLDLHCQDVVEFRSWKSLFLKKYLKKVKEIISHYEELGYNFSLMTEIVKNMSRIKE